jgi:hypothetical protein
MSNIEFEQDGFARSQSNFETAHSGIVGLVMKTIVVQSESQANAVLIGIIIVCIIVVISIIYVSGRPSSTKGTLSPAQVDQLMVTQ